MIVSREAFVEAMQAVDGIVLGKKYQVRLVFTALLAGGHLLIGDFPGVGKTVLVQFLAKVCGLTFQRLQFTSDLSPRAGLALLAAARAWLDGVDFVRPEDLQAVFPAVAGHRLETMDGSAISPLLKQLLASVPLP